VRGEDTSIGHLEREKEFCSRVESRRTVIQGDLSIDGEGLSPRDQFNPKEEEASVQHQQQVQSRIEPYKSHREHCMHVASAEGRVHTQVAGTTGRVRMRAAGAEGHVHTWAASIARHIHTRVAMQKGTYMHVVQIATGTYSSYRSQLQGHTAAAKVLGSISSCQVLLYFYVSIISGPFSQ
jgi:hypothetical protein